MCKPATLHISALISLLLLLSLSACADVRELANNAVIVTNSQLQSPAYALDGNHGTRWESRHGVDEVWLALDLGKKYALQRIEIDWEVASARDFSVQASNDNQSWIALANKTDGSAGARTDTIDLTGQFQFIRILATARSTQWGYSIWELRVFGDDILPLPDQLVSRNAAADSSASIQAVENAFDGRQDTRWESQHGVETGSLTVDLGKVYTLRQMDIHWEAANAARYQVLGSQNKDQWLSLASFSGGSFGNRTDNLTLHGQHRYVRLQAEARSEGNQWGYSIWEMEIYAAQESSVVDSDGDGIADEIDQCPATPPNSSVDGRGCVIRDDYPSRILFIGNSFTEYGPIPELVEQMAHFAGFTDVDIQRRTILGQSLTTHREDNAADGAPQRVLESWDAVILQDLSTRPTDSGDPHTFYQDVTWFNDRIKSANINTQVYLYETWAWRFDKDLYPDRFADPAQMQAEIRYHYNFAATSYAPEHTQFPNSPPIKVVPVGDAWELDLQNGEVDGRLHDPDSHHAGNLGKYLNALVFYSVIFDQSASGMTPLLGLSAAQAAHLQNIANSVTGH
ncbi:hypothetical protein TDB9533_03456 [Thalassocella blandensis]|nr:hypothetical protein TDB9533_03456 [Thalassocella blandensis]